MNFRPARIEFDIEEIVFRDDQLQQVFRFLERQTGRGELLDKRLDVFVRDQIGLVELFLRIEVPPNQLLDFREFAVGAGRRALSLWAVLAAPGQCLLRRGALLAAVGSAVASNAIDPRRDTLSKDRFMATPFLMKNAILSDSAAK